MKKSTVRELYALTVTRQGEEIVLRFTGNGFLYNMVRAITGTVLYAAEGKLAPEDIPVILDSGNRTLAGPTAPPGVAVQLGAAVFILLRLGVDDAAAQGATAPWPGRPLLPADCISPVYGMRMND